MRLTEHRRQAAIALGRTREHHQVLARRVGHARAVVGRRPGSPRTEDRRESERPRRLGETHHAVETVVIGEGQRPRAEARRLAHELLGVARPVEETEARVRVQFARRWPSVVDPHEPPAARLGAEQHRLAEREHHLQVTRADAEHPPPLDQGPGPGVPDTVATRVRRKTTSRVRRSTCRAHSSAPARRAGRAGEPQPDEPGVVTGEGARICPGQGAFASGSTSGEPQGTRVARSSGARPRAGRHDNASAPRRRRTRCAAAKARSSPAPR